jgi:hypothetical protein
VGHRTGPVHCPVRHLAPALTLRAQVALFTVHCSLFTFVVDRWRCSRYSAWHTGQSGATPDRPVNYSGEPFSETRSLAVRGNSPWCTCRRFETGGSLSRRVNVAACPSPDGSTRGRARRGEVRWPEMGVREVEIPRPSCLSRA